MQAIKKVDEPRGPQAKTRRNKDATWTKKGGKSYFGYKLHIKTDIDYGLIIAVETTPANVHDSQIDLSQKGRWCIVTVDTLEHIAKDTTPLWDRGVRGRKINARQKLRNQRISTQKNAMVTSLCCDKKTSSTPATKKSPPTCELTQKNIFSCFSYNLTQLITLQKNNH